MCDKPENVHLKKKKLKHPLITSNTTKLWADISVNHTEKYSTVSESGHIPIALLTPRPCAMKRSLCHCDRTLCILRHRLGVNWLFCALHLCVYE